MNHPLRRVASALTGIFALLVMVHLTRAAELRIVGSDLLGLDFSKTIYGFGVREGVSIAVALDGSRPGFDELKAGRADLALLTLPPGDEPDPATFESLALAWHRVVVIVPVGAPLERVTFDQLRGIFSADAPLTFTRWSDLGLTGEWAEQLIAPLAPANGLGLAGEIVRHVALRGSAYRPQTLRYTSMSDLGQRLAGDTRSIALAATMPAGLSSHRVLPVAAQARDPGFLPTPENLHSGDYPLSLSLRIVFRRDGPAKLVPLIYFLLGDEVADAIQRTDIVPATQPVRRQQLLMLGKK
ncbi:MAG: hypothetical protein Q8N18_10800 [Opitutaceae bacterium]|nr:hypothetical protein [Opitutaceae bacterium]